MFKYYSKDRLLIFFHFLLLFLTIRHSMYYYGLGEIKNEMGFDQTFLSMVLIPVTISFGLAFFMGRPFIDLSRYQILKYFFIASLPFFIASIKFGFSDWKFIFNLIGYKTSPGIGRPSFLILFPIIASILFVYLFQRKRVILYSGWFGSLFFLEYFVVYYFSLFVLFYLLQSSLVQSRVALKLVRWGLVPLFPVLILYIEGLEIQRVSYLAEFLFGLSYMSILYLLALHLPLSSFFSEILLKYRVGVFNFYLSQAVFFTLTTDFFFKGYEFLFVIIVYFSSLVMSFFIGVFEKRVRLAVERVLS